MSDSTKWLRWAHTFSYKGPGDWEWLEVSDDPEVLQDVLHDLGDEYSYSEHYRGIEYTLHDAPDPEWLEKYIKTLEANAVNYARRAEKMAQFLEEIRETA